MRADSDPAAPPAALAGLVDQRLVRQLAEAAAAQVCSGAVRLLGDGGIMGVRTTAAVIVAIGDGTTFPTAGHLASYAGLAPTTKSSGTSIRGEHAPHRGNRLLKRALFQAAFAAIGCKSDPSSRTYYNCQRARGRTHTQTTLRLARQRVNVIHAMIRTGTLYEPRVPDEVGLAA